MVVGGKTSGGLNKFTSTIECFDGTKWSILEDLSNPESKLNTFDQNFKATFFRNYFMSVNFYQIFLD